jgi:hypothetical protein
MVRLCCPSVIEVNVGVSVFNYSRYSLMRQQAYADHQRENITHLEVGAGQNVDVARRYDSITARGVSMKGNLKLDI